MRSSIVASGFTLNALALNCAVSPFCDAAGAVATMITSDKSLLLRVSFISSILTKASIISRGLTL